MIRVGSVVISLGVLPDSGLTADDDVKAANEELGRLAAARL